MTTYVFRNGELVEKAQTESLGLYVISDAMDATRHMCDNKFYTSKSKFRRVTKAHNCVEVGSEPIKQRKPVVLDRGQRRDDIRRAIYELRNGIRR